MRASVLSGSGPRPGEERRLLISDLNVDGGAVARLDGLVYFLDHGLPGAEALARVEALRGNRVEARVLKILRPSPHAVPPFCPQSGACGGCAWQDLDYGEQLAWKRRRVAAALSRLGGLHFAPPPVLPSPLTRGFRAKMEYSFGEEAGGALCLGLLRRHSASVCPLPRGCPLQSEGAALVLRAVLDWAGRQGCRAASGFSASGLLLRRLMLWEARAEGRGRQRLARLVCGSALPPEPALGELYGLLAPLGVTSLLVSRVRARPGGMPSRRPSSVSSGMPGGQAKRAAAPEREEIARVFGSGLISERLGHIVLEFPGAGFAQGNTAAAELLYAEARELAGLGRESAWTRPPVLWDLYAGAGALGLFMAERAGELMGIESLASSTEAAARNALALGFTHCRFLTGEAAELLPALPGHPDVLLLDPPRAGLSPRLIPTIKRLRPERIVYVSCDPAGLARDAAALGPEYALADLRLVDMFPHTPHVESAALFLGAARARSSPQ